MMKLRLCAYCVMIFCLMSAVGLESPASANMSVDDGFLDAAPFARVVAWDAQRKAAVRANRLEAVAEEDLYLSVPLGRAGDRPVVIPSRAEIRKYVGTDWLQPCVGLEWLEARSLRTLSLSFESKSADDVADDVQVEYFDGNTLWQGHWKQLHGTLSAQGNTLVFNVSDEAPATLKIRWIVRTHLAGEKVTLAATTDSRLQETAIVIERAPESPHTRVRLKMYNGRLIEGNRSVTWKNLKLDSPATLRVQHASLSQVNRPVVDETVLRFMLDDGTGFGVAVDDIVERGPIDVRHAGIFIRTADLNTNLKSYRPRVDQQQTVLERVRQMEPQTRVRAMEHTHYDPRLDHGPIMISLACDNAKFIANRQGGIEYFDDFSSDARHAKPNYVMTPSFGAADGSSGDAVIVERELADGWRPMPMTTIEQDGLSYQFSTFVAPQDAENIPTASKWLNEKPVCVMKFVVHNPTDEKKTARVQFNFVPRFRADKSKFHTAMKDGAGLMLDHDTLMAAVIREAMTSDSQIDLANTYLAVQDNIEPGDKISFTLQMPAWSATADDVSDMRPADELATRFMTYWDDIMAGSMEVELPDEWLTNVIRANQAHMLLIARNEDGGRRIAPWIAPDRYWGAIDSEGNSIVRAMQEFGHFEFARRCFAYYFSRYNERGKMTTGYTLMGNGWHLWKMAEYMQLSADDAWLAANLDHVRQLCQWIIDQRQKTMRKNADEILGHASGLLPPAVQADWNNYAYYFYFNSYFYAGLHSIADVLQDYDTELAKACHKEAAGLKDDILDAFYHAQAKAPVVPLQDGTWVPYYPSSLHTPGQMADFFPGQDANRSWAYDVELGAHHMAAMGVMPVDAPSVSWMLNHMEDVQFLATGWGGYPAEKNHADWFNMGGFGKVQPYYARNAEIYAMQDDLKPFLRSYFNSLASLIDGEMLSIYEHFSNFVFNKTHETGYFMHQSRTMLLTEQGNQLWLLPLIPPEWLQAGQTIRVIHAPTRFGQINFEVHVQPDGDQVAIKIDPPTRRRSPEQIVVRLRGPRSRPIESVEVVTPTELEVHQQDQTIRFEPGDDTIELNVRY